MDSQAQMKKETPAELRRRELEEELREQREHFMQLEGYNMVGGQTLEEQREKELEEELREQRELNAQLQANAQSQLGKASARAAAPGSPTQEQAPAQQTYKQRREQTRRTKAARKISGNPKADYVSYGMVERLQDMEERKKDAGDRIDEEVRQGRTEMAGLKAFCQGYHKNKKGEPATDADRHAQENDNKLISSFKAGDLESVQPYLEQFSGEMIQAPVTPDMFTDAYMEAHAAEMKELTEKAAYIKELMGKEAYKPFFDGMPGPVRILLDAKLDVMEKFSAALEDNWRLKGVDAAKNGKYSTDRETPDEDQLKSHKEAFAGSLERYRKAEQEAYDLAAAKKMNKLIEDSDMRKENVKNANIDFHSYMPSGAVGKMMSLRDIIEAHPDAYQQYGEVIDKMYQKVYRLLDTQGDVQLRKEAYQSTSTNYAQYGFFAEGMHQRMLEHRKEDELLNTRIETYVNMMEHFLEGKELSEAGMALVSGDKAMMEAEKQKSFRDRNAADPVGSKMAEQLRDWSIRKENAVRGCAKACRDAGVDGRILNVLSQGYRVDEKGRPLTAEDKRNQEADDKMIQDYLSNDLEKRTPYLQKIVKNITEAALTKEVLDPEYQAEHMAELRQLSANLTVMNNIMNDPVNKPFFDNMPPLDKQLFEARWDLCGPLSMILASTTALKGVDFQHGTYDGEMQPGMKELDAINRETFETALQESDTRYASEQLKDLETRLENAIHGKAHKDVGVDGRILKSFSQGYRVDGNGNPLTEEDAEKKKADDEMISAYLSGDVEQRERCLQQFVREIMEARITKDILDPVYQVEHAAEINKITRQMTYIENATKEPANKSFFDRMPPTQKELFDTKQHMANPLSGLLSTIWSPRGINCNDGQPSSKLSKKDMALMESVRVQLESEFAEGLQEDSRKLVSAQIRDSITRKDNTIKSHRNMDVDGGVLKAFCQGYYTDKDGNPLTKEDTGKKEADDKMIRDYLSQDTSKRTPYLEQFSREIMDARITREILDPEYQVEHMGELRQLVYKMTSMYNVMNNPANKELFFDKMPPAERKLLDAKLTMCSPLANLLNTAAKQKNVNFETGGNITVPQGNIEDSAAQDRERFLQVLTPLEMLEQSRGGETA